MEGVNREIRCEFTLFQLIRESNARFWQFLNLFIKVIILDLRFVNDVVVHV